MQYETIILELMNRIKIMESRCDSLEAALAQATAAAVESVAGTRGQEPAAEDTARRQKVRPEQIRACYDCALALWRQENTDFGGAIDDLVARTHMNPHSAIMTVYAVRAMLTGTVYKRAISRTGTELFWGYIRADFGMEALKTAIRATRAHIDYRRQCGHKVDSLERLCDEYAQGL